MGNMAYSSKLSRQAVPRNQALSNQADAQQQSATRAKGIVFQTRGPTKLYDMGEVQGHAMRGVDLQRINRERNAHKKAPRELH